MNWEDFSLYSSTFLLVLGWCFLLTFKNNIFKSLEKHIGKFHVFLFPLSLVVFLLLTLLYAKVFFGLTIHTAG